MTLSHELHVVSSALVDLLLIGVIASIPLLLARLWLASRQQQLIVTEPINSTGLDGLTGTTLGLAQLIRQRVDQEIRVVATRRDSLHEALQGAARVEGSRRSAPARVRQRLDTSVSDLLSATREVAPQQAQPAIQLLTALMVRPRGLQVATVIQLRGKADSPTLGLSLEVQTLAAQDSIAAQTFWEPAPGESAEEALPERVIRLVAPAARWAAIELVVQSVFLGRTRRSMRGLDRLLTGILLAQTAQATDAFTGNAFRRQAVDELTEATEVMHGSPLRRAAAADALDRIASTWAERAPELYALAHQQYDLVVTALSRLPSERELWQRYYVREATSWLASGLRAARNQALQRLTTAPPDLSESGSAADLYDAACLYALAAEAVADDSQYRRIAATMLVRALVSDDSPNEWLWRQAGKDPQLRILHKDLPVWRASVNNALAAGDGPDEPPDVQRLVEQALTAP